MRQNILLKLVFYLYLYIYIEKWRPDIKCNGDSEMPC